MEVQQLPAIVLILLFVGMIVGIGVLVFDKLGYSQRVSTSVAFGSENVTFAGGVGTVANGYTDSVTAIGNSTANVTAVNITDSLNGALLAAYPELGNGTYFVAYTYNASSPTTTAFTAGSTAVGGIANSWLALVVTVVVLSFILGMVIRNFQGRG